MKRIVAELDEYLHHAFKAYALKRDKSMREIILEMIKKLIAKEK